MYLNLLLSLRLSYDLHIESLAIISYSDWFITNLNEKSVKTNVNIQNDNENFNILFQLSGYVLKL